MNAQSITVGIPVSNLEEGMAWYRQLIGVTEELAPVPGVWECQIMPSVWLQLFEQPREGLNPTIIRFESEQIEADRDLANRLKRRSVVEPVHPFQCRVLYRRNMPPGASTVDDLTPEEPDGRFGVPAVVIFSHPED